MWYNVTKLTKTVTKGFRECLVTFKRRCMDHFCIYFHFDSSQWEEVYGLKVNFELLF